MTSYVLTLIGNETSTPLETNHIERVSLCLQTVSNTDWLADNEACDIFFNSPLTPAEITKQVHQVLSETKIDAVCTPVMGRRKKLLMSDMDSTIIHQECINELADAIGVGDQIGEITDRVISGQINFGEALRQRMALMKGMEFSVLERVYEERVTLMPGARTMVQTMAHHGAYCILVSGGFTFFTEKIAELIGFHDHQGNDLVFKDGKLTGEVLDPILGRTAKLETLKALCQEKNLDIFETLAVGDGANDIKMIKEAGLGVAIHGSESLKENANAWVDHGDLTALLYIQGYHKSEFVST